MRQPSRAAGSLSTSGSTCACGHWERLEARVHLCADHARVAGDAGLTLAQVDYLNKLPLDSPAPFDVAHALQGDGPYQAGAPGPESTAPVTTILDNGPSGNRVDVVLVGDGYTSAQLGTYAGQSQSAVNQFFNQ